MASAVTESALLAALSALLYMASWMPVISSFILLACAMPITVAGVKHGGGKAWLAMLCAAIVIALTGGPSEGFLYLVPFGVLGALCGHFLHIDEEPARHFLLGAGWLFVIMVPAFTIVERVLGLGQSLQELQTGVIWSFQTFAEFFNLRTTWVSTLRDFSATFILCPLAFYAAFSAVMYYSNHLFSFLICWRLRLAVSPPPDLRRLRTPRALLVLVPALALASSLTGPTSKTVTASLALNSFAIVLFIAYVCGFALTVIALDRSPLKPLARMAISLLMMFLLFPLTTLLGLADAALDLRRTVTLPPKPLQRF